MCFVSVVAFNISKRFTITKPSNIMFARVCFNGNNSFDLPILFIASIRCTICWSSYSLSFPDWRVIFNSSPKSSSRINNYFVVFWIVPAVLLLESSGYFRSELIGIFPNNCFNYFGVRKGCRCGGLIVWKVNKFSSLFEFGFERWKYY